MSVFSSLIRAAGFINAAQLQTVLESKLPLKIFAGSSAAISSASGSYANMHSVALTDIEVDDVGIVLSQASISCGTTGDLAYLQHRINAVDKGNICPSKEHTGNTSGVNDSCTLISYFENLSGSFNVDLRWARTFGAGTIYSSNASTIVIVGKKR